MNPRYVAYAAAHGRTADEQLAHDKQRPGGGNMNYIAWITRRLEAWRQAHGVARFGPVDREAFDAELAAEFGGQS